MKNLRRLAFVGAALALAGVLWFLYDKTQAGNFLREDGIIANLRVLEALDAEWTVDSLRAKTGINHEFASGQSPGERAVALKATLSGAVNAFGDPALTDAVTQINDAINTKKAVTARFVEQNKILRESLVFVTDQSAEFLAQLRELQSETTSRKANKANEELSTLGLRINELLTETLKYNLLSDTAALPRIDSSLNDLTAKVSTYPANLAPIVAALIDKFRTVQKQKAVEDTILNEIAALPMQKRISALETLLNTEKQKITTSTDFYRTLLIGYSALLLALLGWLAWRLAQSYGLIQRKNIELASANEHLEQRVNERTAELGDALQHLKDSESALVQSEKMSSLGQMIAGVAHEINTPLAYVRSGLEVLDEQLPHTTAVASETLKLLDMLSTGEASKDALSTQFARVQDLCHTADQGHGAAELSAVIKDGLYGIDQISEIVLNLKNFSRLDRAKVSRFDLNEGIDSTLIIAKHLVKDKTIRKDFTTDAHVTGSPSQINQVFLNLITNAAHATGADGVISIRTLKSAHNVRVEIEDNGSGIPPEVLPKIFDPFFTTKKVGEGTGLGLSIVYKIITEHGGKIDVKSTVGQGTCFSITLPIDVVDIQKTQPLMATT